MLYSLPALDSDDHRVLVELDEFRQALRHQLGRTHRWTGRVRRVLVAHAIQGSNSIEGYNVSLDDAEAAVDGEDPLDADSATWAEIVGYRDALAYIQQLAGSAEFRYDYMLLNALHYMMLKHQLDKWPGRFRPGEVRVQEQQTGVVVYTAPDPDLVGGMMIEFADWLNGGDLDAPFFVRAAMAHLNLVKIHPWRDGNGRMSRALQTLLLARDRVVAPEFSSIEEWLGVGRNTYAYYDVLSEVGGAVWSPDRDTHPWVRFCLRAHHMQAQTVIRRIERASRVWAELDQITSSLSLPERTAGALFAASSRSRVRRSVYQNDESLTYDQAVRDLRGLVGAGLLEQHGQTKGRFYVASARLVERLAPVTVEPGPPIRDPYTG